MKIYLLDIFNCTKKLVFCDFKNGKKIHLCTKKSFKVKKNEFFGLKLHTFFHISDHSADGGQERVSFQQLQPLQVPNPLAFLHNQEPFQQMKRLLQQNPNLLGALLRHVGQANPELFNIIRQNRDAFMLLVNEPDQSK